MSKVEKAQSTNVVKERGSHFSHISFNVSGLMYPEWIARFSLGEGEVPQVSSCRGKCYAFFYFKMAVTLMIVIGLEASIRLPNINSVECRKQPGNHVSMLGNSMKRIGCIVTLSETRKKVTAAEVARNQIQFNIKPDQTEGNERISIQ